MAMFINPVKFKNSISAVTLLLGIAVFGQYGDEFNSIKNQFPDSKKVRLLDEIIISVKFVNETFEIKQSTVQEDLYMDDSATYGSRQSLDFSSFFELENINAHSLENVNGKYKSNKVTEFIEKDALDNSFHDDIKTLNFIYSNLSKASKTRLEYTEIIKNPRFLRPFYFRDFHPLKHKKVTLIADKNIQFRFQEFNTQPYSINFSKEEKRGNIIYSWEIQDVDQIKTEEHVPSYRNVMPHIIPIITNYQVNNESKTLLEDVSDLYNWYFSLTKDINLTPPDDALVSLTKSLIQDKDTKLDKVKSIYYWTQQNIKYIDFEFELGGFIPREANDVYHKKYGDCKDNSSILFEMLKIANLEGYLTWIGTREIPYTYQDVPTPIVDNHMILTYIEDKDIYFLDATGRHLPIEMPSSFIQGKEALIGMGEEKFQMATVPIVPANKNIYKQNTRLQLSNSKLIGQAEVEFSGYFKVDVFNEIESRNSQQKLLEYYNSKFRKGNNKFLIKEYAEQHKFDYDQNFVVTYDFDVDDHAKQLLDEVFINLNLNKELSYFKTDLDRENALEVRYKSTYQFENILEIPEGYVVEYLPDAQIIENDYFSSSITYQKENNTIRYEHTLVMDYLTISAEDQKIVNKDIKQVEHHYKEIVILKKISN